MKKYLPLFLLITFHFSSAQKKDNVINVPKGGSLLTGEVINEYVWQAAVKFKTENGGEVYLTHDGNYLYIGFRGIYEPWSHLYINNRSKVYVMHVTASMGRVVYNMNHYGAWHPDRQFNWKMRHTEYDPDKKIDAEQFLQSEGWITHTDSRGDKKEVVFKIALKNLDRKNIYTAFVFGFKNDKYMFWPNTLNDDTLKPEIFTGYNPSDLNFDFRKWALLKLSE